MAFESPAPSVVPVISPYIWYWRGLGWGGSNVSIQTGSIFGGAGYAFTTSGGANSIVSQRGGWVNNVTNPTGDSSTGVLTELGCHCSSTPETADAVEFGYKFRATWSAAQAGGGVSAGLFGASAPTLLRGATPVSALLFLGISAEPSVSGPNWVARSKATTADGYTDTLDTGIPVTTEARVEVVMRSGPTLSAYVNVNGTRMLTLAGASVPGSPPDVAGSLMYLGYAFGTANASVLRWRRLEAYCRSIN